MKDLGRIKKIILRARSIAVAGHINPDGDSIGSLLALGLGLEKLGKRVYMICEEDLPQKYRHLPGAGRIIRKLQQPIDMAIAVDCSNKEILGSTYHSFKKANDLLEIDHHAFRRPFGNISLIDKKAGAVGELIFLILSEMRVKIDKEIAHNLMTSIIVETNSFRLPKARPLTFEVCAYLMDIGVNFYKLVDMVFWSKTRESAIISGLCMERCKFLKNNSIVWSIVRQKDFLRTGAKDEDVDGVPDEMRSIRNTKIALLFREKDSKTLRVSLRSRGNINVAGIAEHYNGGGHFDMAGCTIVNDRRSIDELLKRAETLLPK